MDLDRLKIADPPTGRRSFWGTALLCLVCLALGFGAAKFLAAYHPAASTKVKTMVLGPAAASKAKAFRAGGWIEVATPAYPILIASRIAERIEAITVREGDWAEPGKLLVKFDETNRKKALALAEARVATTQKELDKLKVGYRREDVQAAEARVQQAAEQLRYAKAKYERLKNLSRDVMSEELVDQSLATYRAAEAQFNEDVANRNKLLAGYQLEDIAIAQARIEEASAARNMATLELSYCTIAAPESGPRLRVLRVLRHVGDWINPDKPSTLLELYNPAEMQARADVTQPNVKYVKIGDKVQITTEAFPGHEYTGTVLRIDPLAELAKNTLTVRLRIDAPDEMLFPEMVAQVAFSAGEAAEKDSALLLPKQALQREGSQTFVFLCQDGTSRRNPVTVESEQGDLVRIAAGLTSGQRVVISASGVLQDGTRIEEE
jgi:RND family efflux transporter MFP subunit